MQPLIRGYNMRYIKYLILLILLIPVLAWAKGYYLVSGVQEGAPIYTCIGFTTDCESTTLPSNSLSGTDDFTFVREATITTPSTAIAVKVAVGSDWPVNNAWAVLYRLVGTDWILIGKGLINSPTTSAWNQVTLSAESGQSLDLEADDVVRFGYSVDPSGTFYYLRNNTGGAGGYYITSNVSSGPVATIAEHGSWEFSTDRNMGFVLVVEE